MILMMMMMMMMHMMMMIMMIMMMMMMMMMMQVFTSTVEYVLRRQLCRLFPFRDHYVPGFNVYLTNFQRAQNAQQAISPGAYRA